MIDAKKSFYGEDGLLYCAVCGEALEAFYPQNFIMKGGNIRGNVHVSGKFVKKRKSIERKRNIES